MMFQLICQLASKFQRTGRPQNKWPTDSAKRLSLAKHVLKKVVQDVDKAIMIRALYFRCANEANVIEPFNNTWEAHGFNVVREALLVDLIMTLMRIYDRANPSTASLPTVAALLSDRLAQVSITQELTIQQRERPAVFLTEDQGLIQWMERNQQQRAPKIANEVASRALRYIEMIKQVGGHSEHQRLRNLRNEILAHKAITGRAQGMARPIQKAKYGDAEAFLDKIIEPSHGLAAAFLGIDYDFDETSEIWTLYADAFWKRVASGKKQEIDWSQKSIYS